MEAWAGVSGRGRAGVKGARGMGSVSGTGVLRCAQDDSRNKQRQKQTTAKTSNGRNKQWQKQTTAETNNGRNKQRQKQTTTETNNDRNKQRQKQTTASDGPIKGRERTDDGIDRLIHKTGRQDCWIASGLRERSRINCGEI